MLFINHNSPKVIKAKQEFHKNMIDFVLRRIDKLPALPTINHHLAQSYFGYFINDHLDDILTGNPYRLIELHNGAAKNIKADLRRAVEYVFNYSAFICKTKRRYGAYDLAEALDINTCTYCNRNYTSTVATRNGRKITRPEFDHYFDKASHPLLAVSFYNLIPCCSTCNSRVKGSTPMDLINYPHPYVDNLINDFRFSYKYVNDGRSGVQITVTAPNPSKTRNMIQTFAIEQVYNAHRSELLDILKVRQFFSDKYLEFLTSSLLKDVIVSREDLYRVIFGAEYSEDSFINRPFSKFKSDILKELGII